MRLRARLRRAREDASLLPGLAGELEWPLSRVAALAAAPAFGAAWEDLSAECPALRARPVPVAELDKEMSLALRIRAGLRPAVPALDAAD